MTETLALEAIRKHRISAALHNVRGLLFASRGYAKLTLEERDGPLTDAQRSYLEAVSENLEKVAGYVGELHDCLGENNGLQVSELSFAELIGQAVSRAVPDGQGNGVVFKRNVTGLLSTNGDREKLDAAIASLIAAAVEFTGHLGSVEVLAREEKEKIRIRVTALRNSQSLSKKVPEISFPSNIWRLHGGEVSIACLEPNRCELLCELPVIR